MFRFHCFSFLPLSILFSIIYQFTLNKSTLVYPFQYKPQIQTIIYNLPRCAWLGGFCSSWRNVWRSEHTLYQGYNQPRRGEPRRQSSVLKNKVRDSGIKIYCSFIKPDLQFLCDRETWSGIDFSFCVINRGELCIFWPEVGFKGS